MEMINASKISFVEISVTQSTAFLGVYELSHCTQNAHCVLTHCTARYLEAVEVLAKLDRVAHQAQTHRRQLFRVAHVEPERGANQRVATDKALAGMEGGRRR